MGLDYLGEVDGSIAFDMLAMICMGIPCDLIGEVGIRAHIRRKASHKIRLNVSQMHNSLNYTEIKQNKFYCHHTTFFTINNKIDSYDHIITITESKYNKYLEMNKCYKIRNI